MSRTISAGVMPFAVRLRAWAPGTRSPRMVAHPERNFRVMGHGLMGSKACATAVDSPDLLLKHGEVVGGGLRDFFRGPNEVLERALFRKPRGCEREDRGLADRLQRGSMGIAPARCLRPTYAETLRAVEAAGPVENRQRPRFSTAPWAPPTDTVPTAPTTHLRGLLGRAVSMGSRSASPHPPRLANGGGK